MEISPAELRQLIAEELHRHDELNRERLRNMVRDEIATAMVDGWGEYRKLVIETLRAQDQDIRANTRAITELRSSVDRRASLVGAVAAVIVALLGFAAQAVGLPAIRP